MSKRILSAALALALSLSLAAPAFAEEKSPFNDVPLDHWAIDAIRQAAEEYIVSGMDYQNFAPDDPLTAAQFVTIITRAFYWRELRAIEKAEKEVREDWTWYIHNRETAERAGLMEGVGVEDWDAPMTRYQMAVMLYNVVVDKELALPDKAVLEAVEITDWDQIPEEFQEAVSTAYAMGLLSGMEDGSFAGDQTLTRAQAAVVFAKLDKAMEVKDGLLERALDKEERYYTRYSFLSYSFSRYPGELGTACVATQGGLPHGAQTSMVFIYQDGSVLNIGALLPPGYRLSGIGGYLNPSKIRFNETGDKLTFVTPIEEGIPSKPGDGSTGIWAEYKDWGPTLCTVDLISGTMESLEPLTPFDLTEWKKTLQPVDFFFKPTSELSFKIINNGEWYDHSPVVNDDHYPNLEMFAVVDQNGINIAHLTSLISDPEFLAGDYGKAFSALRGLSVPVDGDTPERREQVGWYLQVEHNGQPVAGTFLADYAGFTNTEENEDLWSVPKGEYAVMRFAFDQPVELKGGDTLTFRLGLPQESQNQ